MADNAKVTAARLYAELRGNNIRVTSVRALGEYQGNTALRVTRVGGYTELSGSDTRLSATAINAYAETSADPERIKVSATGIYVELSPGVSGTPINPPLPDNDTYHNVKVTDLIMLAGAQLTGILMPQFYLYAEILDAQLRATKFGILPEIQSTEFHVTKFAVLVEIRYEEPQVGGVIIVGSHKTWRDHYPQNTTDIRPFEAYNFIISANGMYMINLEWDAVEGADGYEIERSLNGTTGWTLIQVTDEDVVQYISISLEPNTTYYYRIRSFNEGGYSDYSDVVSETTQKIGPHLLSKEQLVNTTSQIIQIPKSNDIGTGDFMLMQIGIQDTSDIIYPPGWTVETTIPSGEYTNVILSRTALADEADYYEIERTSDERPIVTVALFAWDARHDNIIFYDG